MCFRTSGSIVWDKVSGNFYHNSKRGGKSLMSGLSQNRGLLLRPLASQKTLRSWAAPQIFRSKGRESVRDIFLAVARKIPVTHTVLLNGCATPSRADALRPCECIPCILTPSRWFLLLKKHSSAFQFPLAMCAYHKGTSCFLTR